MEDTLHAEGWIPAPDVIAAEEAVLGAAIQSKSAAETASAIVTSGQFFRPAHQLVFEAVTRLVEDGQDVTPMTVLSELTRTGNLTRVGGGPALHQFMERSALGSLEWAARKVAADHLRRSVHEVGTRIAQLAGTPAWDAEQHLDEVRGLLEAAAAPVTGTQPPTVGELMWAALDRLEQPLTTADLIPPPYQDLERLVPGFKPGELIVIGARPAMGKTLVALDIARSTSVRLGLPVLLHSLEMSGIEITYRFLAAEAGVLLNKFATRTVDDLDWQRISKIQDRVQEAPLVIDDSPRTTLARIRARLRGMARTHGGARLAVIDYLGLMDTPRADTREQSIAATTRGLKLLAKEFGIPIILLVQLNRETANRPDKIPVMSDLRESGAIEADADLVILLHREDAYDKETPRAGELDLIVAKYRHGSTGTVAVAFQGQYARAADMWNGR